MLCKIISEYYEWLYGNKCSTLGEKVNCLDNKLFAKVDFWKGSKFEYIKNKPMATFYPAFAGIRYSLAKCFTCLNNLYDVGFVTMPVCLDEDREV